jgi:hypothetical protein
MKKKVKQAGKFPRKRRYLPTPLLFYMFHICNQPSFVHQVTLLSMDHSRSDTAVNVMEACVVSFDSIGEECAIMDDKKLDDVAVSFPFLMLLTLRSMKSLIIAGLLIFSKSTSISPLSMVTTFDMWGRCLVTSCVHKSPILRYLQASATSKSSPRELSTIFSRLPCS